MAFFSKDLTINNLAKNTFNGLYLVIEEWYWLIATAYFNYRVEKLKKQNKQELAKQLSLYQEKVREALVQKRKIFFE